MTPRLPRFPYPWLLRVLGKQPSQRGFGGRAYLDGPSGGPEWGVRFTRVFLSPK